MPGSAAQDPDLRRFLRHQHTYSFAPSVANLKPASALTFDDDIIDETDLDQAAVLIDTYVRDAAQRTPKVAVLRRPAA